MAELYIAIAKANKANDQRAVDILAGAVERITKEMDQIGLFDIDVTEAIEAA